jgi:hypothetical protein
MLAEIMYWRQMRSPTLREEHRQKMKNAVFWGVTPCNIAEDGILLVLTIAMQRNIPENCVFHSHRRPNLKSYIDRRCMRRRSGGNYLASKWIK